MDGRVFTTGSYVEGKMKILMINLPSTITGDASFPKAYAEFIENPTVSPIGDDNVSIYRRLLAEMFRKHIDSWLKEHLAETPTVTYHPLGNAS